MKDQFQRRAWALLLVLGSFVAAAAVWTLPDDRDLDSGPEAYNPQRPGRV